MPESIPTRWLDVLWPAVCARVTHPVTGVKLDADATAKIASMVVGQFLDEHDHPPATLELAHRWMAGRASMAAMIWVASERGRTGNPQLYCDTETLDGKPNPGVHAIDAAARTTLTDFERYLLTVLFAEGSQTRREMANDPWVLQKAGLDVAAF